MTRIRQFLLRDEQDESQVTHHDIKGNQKMIFILFMKNFYILYLKYDR